MVNEQQNKIERLASNGESFYIQKHPLKKTKQPSRKEICCRGNQKRIRGDFEKAFFLLIQKTRLQKDGFLFNVLRYLLQRKNLFFSAS